jgi:probable phosphoglycerate mutase
MTRIVARTDLPDNGGMPDIVLIRHGETEWSASGQHTSRTDIALTARGEEQAGRVGAPLAGWRFVAVWSSPRRRARRTAELAGLAVTAVEDDLAEWDYGEYEGITTAQIRQARPDWHSERAGTRRRDRGPGRVAARPCGRPPPGGRRQGSGVRAGHSLRVLRHAGWSRSPTAGTCGSTRHRLGPRLRARDAGGPALELWTARPSPRRWTHAVPGRVPALPARGQYGTAGGPARARLDGTLLRPDARRTTSSSRPWPPASRTVADEPRLTVSDFAVGSGAAAGDPDL